MRVHAVFVVAWWTAACNSAAVHDAPPTDSPIAAAPVEPPAEPIPHPTAHEAERERQQRIRNAIADRWGAEHIDADWQATREQELRAAIAAPPFPPTALRSIACRSTMCRIVVEHASVEDRERFFEATAGSPFFTDDLLGYFPEPELRTDSEVWIARVGYDLRAPAAAE